MGLENLDRGEKVDCHITFFEPELALLDSLARKYRTSRSAVLSALLADYVAAKSPSLAGKVPEPSRPQYATSRRSGAGRPPIVTKPLTDTYDD